MGICVEKVTIVSVVKNNKMLSSVHEDLNGVRDVAMHTMHSPYNHSILACSELSLHGIVTQSVYSLRYQTCEWFCPCLVIWASDGDVVHGSALMRR